jgi:hypothetical protein
VKIQQLLCVFFQITGQFYIFLEQGRGKICHIVLAKDELHKEAVRTSRGFLPFSLLFYN